MTSPTTKLDGAMMTTLTRERRASLEWAIEAAVTKGYAADADVIRDLLSELLSASKPAAPQTGTYPPCQGMNCGCTDGVNHSAECFAEHAATIAGGRFSKGFTAAPAQSEEPVLPAWFDAFLTNVCEIPDRNSPEGEPEAIVATLKELKSCALNAIEKVTAGECDERPIDPADISAAADEVQRAYGISGDVAEQIAVAVIDTLMARGNHSAAQPAQSAVQDERAAFRTAVEEMVRMLEEGEWAEHVSTCNAPGDDLAMRLEVAITDLHNHYASQIAMASERAASPQATATQPAQTRALTIEQRAALVDVLRDWKVSAGNGSYYTTRAAIIDALLAAQPASGGDRE